MHHTMLTDQDRELEVPCSYRVPPVALPFEARKRRSREEAEVGPDGQPVDPLACGAKAGELCRNPLTKELLGGQSSHLPRRRRAGTAPAPRCSGAYT